MNKKVEFPEHVIIVDVEFLNFMSQNFKGFLTSQLNREIDDISVADLFACLALDAKIEQGKRDIQVLLLHDKSTTQLVNATPSNLGKELDGKAFKSTLGEFVFSTVSTANLTTVDGLFNDLLELALDSEKVEKILLIGDEGYDDKVLKTIKEKETDKEIYQFRMREPEKELPYNWDMLAFPLMKAFGVEAGEIK